MKLKILAVVVLAAVGVGAVVYVLGGATGGSARSTQYLTSAAAIGNVTDDVAATGTLAAEARYGLVFGSDPYLVTDTSTAPTSSTTWPVKEVKVKVGDTVKKGDVIATADTADLKRQLATAQNDYRSAQVSLRAAKTTLSDARTAAVTAQIRQAEIGLYNAKNQLATAAQNVVDLKNQLTAATITSPIDGVVTEVNVTAGFDAPTGPAAVIDSPGFQVTTDVVESDLTDVKVGQAATIDVSAVGASLDGTVAAISPVAGSSSSSSSSVVSYPVTVTLSQPPASLRSGMTADVTITIASAENVLTVPAAALRGTTGNYTVLVLDAAGQPQATPVDVGLVTNTTAEIKSGLSEGQAVVTGTASSRTGTTTTGGFGGGVGFPVGGGGNFGGNRGNGNNAPQIVTNGN